MYISHIKISNFRNFHQFSIDFHDGLNVIVGANNAGKTGLLKAINLLSEPGKISAEDFNKNDLLFNFNSKYKESSPEIIIEYHIKHDISEDDTTDESIIKLLSFIGMDEIVSSKGAGDDPTRYTLSACVKAKYALEPKHLTEYLQAVSTTNTFEEFYSALTICQKYYSWTYTNGVSDTIVDAKEATKIFRVDFIEAERNSEAVYSETKREIESFLKSDPAGALKLQKIQQELSQKMKEAIDPVLGKISGLVEHEKNDIGLSKGNVAISQDLRPSTTISGAYVIDVKDTKSGYVVPLSHNGLGYNNLINMYMLVKLVEIQKGKDFRILCLEKPEAHLHPAMQYKLFKFLKKLDEEDNLNQQIFVTTHSSNITAVAGLDNMYMLAYDRDNFPVDCRQQSLKKQFENDEPAKKHMMKFLDVTRSDMLFADKVIFVEGIAEKLLLPKFLEKCGYPYEDEHISIVEVGGKNFAYFVRAFANNPVKKKVLCITDGDFVWKLGNSAKTLAEYKAHIPTHVSDLNSIFAGDTNVKTVIQKSYGSTFEDDLFMCNIGNSKVSKALLKLALPTSLHAFISKYGISFEKWDRNRTEIPTKSQEKIFRILDSVKESIVLHPDESRMYKGLFFAKLFYAYAEKKKGDIALGILVDEELMRMLKVPPYIKGGIKWLST